VSLVGIVKKTDHYTAFVFLLYNLCCCSTQFYGIQVESNMFLRIKSHCSNFSLKSNEKTEKIYKSPIFIYLF